MDKAKASRSARVWSVAGLGARGSSLTTGTPPDTSSGGLRVDLGAVEDGAGMAEHRDIARAVLVAVELKARHHEVVYLVRAVGQS